MGYSKTEIETMRKKVEMYDAKQNLINEIKKIESQIKDLTKKKSEKEKELRDFDILNESKKITLKKDSYNDFTIMISDEKRIVGVLVNFGEHQGGGTEQALITYGEDEMWNLMRNYILQYSGNLLPSVSNEICADDMKKLKAIVTEEYNKKVSAGKPRILSAENHKILK